MPLAGRQGVLGSPVRPGGLCCTGTADSLILPHSSPAGPGLGLIRSRALGREPSIPAKKKENTEFVQVHNLTAGPARRRGSRPSRRDVHRLRFCPSVLDILAGNSQGILT